MFVHEPAKPVAPERLAKAVGQAARTYSRSASINITRTFEYSVDGAFECVKPQWCSLAKR